VTRLQHERDSPLSVEAGIHELLDRLTDHELLELAEQYGMQVLPTVTTRNEAVTFLTTRLADPALQRDIRGSLSPRAQQLLDRLSSEQRPLPVSVLLTEPHWSFGELRRTIAELGRWGLLWRTTEEDGQLSLLLPSLLSGVRVEPTRPQPIALAQSMTHWPPTITLLDLLTLLARVHRGSDAARPTGSRTKDDRTRAATYRWFRHEPSEQASYFEFLQRIARTLGLLGSGGTVDRVRLASWLQLPFPQQGRRLFRAWRFTLHPEERAEADRILRMLRSLAINTWYEWAAIASSCPLSGKPEYRHERLARELEWAGVLARGQTTVGTLAVRVTPWGAWLLGFRTEPPVHSLTAKLSARGCPPVELATLTPELTWLLLGIGDPHQAEQAPHWQVTPQSVARYVATATRSETAPRAPEELAQVVLRTLEAAHGRPLPPVWQDTLFTWFAQSRPARARSALHLRFSTPEDRERARAALETARWPVTPLGQLDLLVVDFESRHRARLVSLLRRAGFALDWSSGTNEQGTPRSP
ncbi:MAG: hypothetical protein ACK42I_03570, partial [Thermomicrobium sp.]